MLALDWAHDPGDAIMSVIRKHHLSDTDALALREGLLSFMIERIDATVQQLYRDHFATTDLTGLTHHERVDSLLRLRDPVRRTLLDWNISHLTNVLGFPEPEAVADRARRRLVNGPLPIDRLTFRFTRHCNIACAHCYNESGPHRKARRLDDAYMHALIAQMPGAGLDKLSLTGGEPFLYHETLISCIRAARAHGVGKVSIPTNAFWAQSEQAALKVLVLLEQAGFDPGLGRDCLIVSSGQYHGEFIDPTRCATLAEVYSERYRRPLLIQAEFDDPTRTHASAFLRDHFAGLSPEHAEIEPRRVNMAGRAEGQAELGQRRRTEFGPCHSIDRLVVDFDGAVRPCCGMNADNEGLVITRRRDVSLAELLRTARNDPILQRIASEPMHTLPMTLGRMPDPAGYPDICRACHHAIGDLVDTEAVGLRLFGRQRFYPFTLADLGLADSPGAENGPDNRV
ncbi:MAG: radical SAM protein [Gammaproteobacteria bacterium]